MVKIEILTVIKAMFKRKKKHSNNGGMPASEDNKDQRKAH